MKNYKGNYGYLGNLKQQAKDIVDCLGGGDKAISLLLETAAVETHAGVIKDRTIYAGMGLTQFDKLPFYNIKKRGMRFRKKILKCFGIDISLVKWEHLRYNPFLSLLFTRIYYLLIRESIPQTEEKRAKYWKKYYNSYLGKGTIAHYLDSIKYVLDKDKVYLA